MRALYEGYVQALEEAGGGLSRTLVSEVDEFAVEAGRLGLARLLELRDAPSAVFVGAAALTLGMFHEAKSRGMEIRQDLAIVGYSDFPVAALFEPALTMVSIPAHEMGSEPCGGSTN